MSYHNALYGSDQNDPSTSFFNLDDMDHLPFSLALLTDKVKMEVA